MTNPEDMRLKIEVIVVLGKPVDKSDPMADPLGDRSYVGIKVANGQFLEFDQAADDHALANRIANRIADALLAQVRAAVAKKRAGK